MHVFMCGTPSTEVGNGDGHDYDYSPSRNAGLLLCVLPVEHNDHTSGVLLNGGPPGVKPPVARHIPQLHGHPCTTVELQNPVHGRQQEGSEPLELLPSHPQECGRTSRFGVQRFLFFSFCASPTTPHTTSQSTPSSLTRFVLPMHIYGSPCYRDQTWPGCKQDSQSQLPATCNCQAKVHTSLALTHTPTGTPRTSLPL